jgi:hypothetical protein
VNLPVLMLLIAQERLRTSLPWAVPASPPVPAGVAVSSRYVVTVGRA